MLKIITILIVIFCLKAFSVDKSTQKLNKLADPEEVPTITSELQDAVKNLR